MSIVKKTYSYFFFSIILGMLYCINYFDVVFLSNFWDIVSFGFIFIIYRLMVLDSIFRVGIMILIERSLKYMTRNIEICKRPDGAVNVNLMNLGGTQSGQPGFPSGHVTVTTFYALKYINYPYNYILIGLMGFSRYFKCAHNLFQICSGFLLGLLFT